MTRVLLGLAGAAIVVALFFVLRPGGDDDDEAAPPTTTTTAATAPTTTRATTRKPAPPPVRTIRLLVRGGRPAGAIRRPVINEGRRLVIVVRSDVSDHVHVHGYDLFRDVAPGKPARFRFRATIVGRFEVELEDRHLLLAQLEVRP